MTTPASHTSASTAARQGPHNGANPEQPAPPKRRNSEAEQEKLLAQVAQTRISPRPEPSSYDGVLELDDFNPLSDNVEESSYLAPFDSEGYTEMERKVVALFKDRIARAQREIPKGVPLKIFKHGDDCRSLAEKLMKESDKTP